MGHLNGWGECMNNPEVRSTTYSNRPDSTPSRKRFIGRKFSGAFLNSVSSARYRLGSQERASRECPSRTLLGSDVREGPVREYPHNDGNGTSVHGPLFRPSS